MVDTTQNYVKNINSEIFFEKSVTFHIPHASNRTDNVIHQSL